jgi:hypothetical protein
MATMFSRLSQYKKKIVLSTFSFSLTCLVLIFLISSDIIILTISESIKEQIFMILFAFGILPPFFIFLLLSGRRKVKRRAFTKITKDRVLKRQNYQCNVCRINSEHWDFDHIGSRGDNSAKNCQALCLNCHREKTVRESRQRKK